MEEASQDKREKNTNYQPETHVRNVNSREIFKNNRLTSQFLRNYTNIPLLSNVMPEDIEDVSEKYQAFLGVEFESDTIKKVYIRNADGTIEKEVYVLSLFRKVSEEMVESIYGNAPDEIKEIYKKILWSLLMKLKVPNEEASNIIGEIGGHDMGYLFENMDKMDIQAERRNTAREKQRADEEKQRADIAEEQVAYERKEKEALAEEVQRLRKLLELQEQK